MKRALPVQRTEIDLSQSRIRDDHAKVVVLHGKPRGEISPGRMSAMAHWVRKRMSEKGFDIREFPTYHCKSEKVFPIYGQSTCYFGGNQ